MDELLVNNFDASMKDVSGQLSKRSRRIYEHDIKSFADWLLSQGLTPQTLTRSLMIDYRTYLQEHYKVATAARMFSVARRILKEQVDNQQLPVNVAENIRGFTVANETTHTALDLDEARELLRAVDQSTRKGKRDYAILTLLLRTGIRRSECANLTMENIKKQQGHTTVSIEHGKGDKRRTIKLPVDVYRVIETYVKETGISVAPDAPLFVGFTKGDRPTGRKISDKLIERVVKAYAKEIEIDSLTPHGLRASFVTLALEGGAKLQQVQYAAGHADPRTTERYQKRKLNLDDNAVDYIHL